MPALGTAAPCREADPVAAVGRFLAGFTHRLRSPLTGLRGYGELAEREEDRARRAYWHQQLQGGLDSLDLLLEGLRRYQLPERLTRRPQPARRLVEDAWGLAGRITPGGAAKGVTLRLDLPEAREWWVDGFHYRNLLVNLLQNALDASPTGGDVRVSEDGEAAVRVEDDGPGLGGLSAAEIVQPFFTTRTDRAGLGLTVASRIAREHGQGLRWQARPTGGLAALIVNADPAEQQRSPR